MIGASAGGIDALQDFLSALPDPFTLPIIVVQHIGGPNRSLLPSIFRSHTRLATKEADEKECLAPATLYFAPPNYHLLIEADHRLALSTEPPVNFSRPSIDVLFDSASLVFWDRLLGIVLSGANCDGASGLYRIRQRGGGVWVQSPRTAQVATMPEAAIRAASPSLIDSPRKLGLRLARLV